MTKEPAERLQDIRLHQRIAELEQKIRLLHSFDSEVCADLQSMLIDAGVREAGLTNRVAELEKEVRHWRANHDNRVKAARMLIDRPDIPLERVAAYQSYLELQSAVEFVCDALAAQVDDVRRCRQLWLDECGCGLVNEVVLERSANALARYSTKHAA